MSTPGEAGAGSAAALWPAEWELVHLAAISVLCLHLVIWCLPTVQTGFSASVLLVLCLRCKAELWGAVNKHTSCD